MDANDVKGVYAEVKKRMDGQIEFVRKELAGVRTGRASTDMLAGVLPRVQIHALKGQAHEGMTTAPEMYVDSVLAFLRPEIEEAREASAA